MLNPCLTRNAARVLALFIAGMLWVFASHASQQAESHADLFRQKVLPVFEQNCAFCHGSKVQRSGLDLRTEESVLRGGARGAAVTPGNPAKSLIYRLVTHAEEPAMPMGGGKITDAEIAIIRQWIEALPADLAKNAAEAKVPVRPPGYKITDEDRQFWSFQKPVRPAVPPVKNRAWVRNEIDAFILKRLEENNLAPAPPAEPRALLRRVYIDLTGLPPTPEETGAFLADPSDAAYEKVIEKLLASPHYGERWGRHWLDAARYADTDGFEKDKLRQIWLYRDWVINAFNRDLPCDQFLIQQIAGDELPHATQDQIVATGFLRNAMLNEEGGVDP
ncbi:MAG TPA: DUF1549 domain-containing protein, partial [Blastocatellia bacterium]|nr:DUF1549 domain-containing protein [Blastocatellia bacterium]